MSQNQLNIIPFDATVVSALIECALIGSIVEQAKHTKIRTSNLDWLKPLSIAAVVIGFHFWNGVDSVFGSFMSLGAQYAVPMNIVAVSLFLAWFGVVMKKQQFKSAIYFAEYGIYMILMFAFLPLLQFIMYSGILTP